MPAVILDEIWADDGKTRGVSIDVTTQTLRRLSDDATVFLWGSGVLNGGTYFTEPVVNLQSKNIQDGKTIFVDWGGNYQGSALIYFNTNSAIQFAVPVEDTSSLSSLDPNNRYLYASDGKTVVMDYSSQQSTTGTVTGHTAGKGTTVLDDSTFTGNSGSTAYTIGDIVLALKTFGLIAT